MCVAATARGALARGYEVVLPRPRSVDEVVLDNEVMGSGRRDDQHP